MDDALKQRLTDALAKMEADADPMVRAASILVRCGQWPLENRSDRGMELKRSTADRAPEVRLATALAADFYYRRDELDPTILDTLRKDADAAVRAAAWFRPTAKWDESFVQDSREPDLAAAASGLHDGNPVVRTFCLDHMGRLLYGASQSALRQAASNVADMARDDGGKLHAALTAAGVQHDPWLNVAAEAVLAGLTGMWCAAADANKSIHGSDSVPPGLPQEQEKAYAAIARLFGSGKRSHAMLACAMLAEEWLANGVGREPQRFPPIAAFAESPHLPTRLAAIVACGGTETEAARLLAALDSPDDLERLAALCGCLLGRPQAVSPELAQRLTVLMRGEPPLESSIAARALGWSLPFDDAVALLGDQCRRQPGSAAAIELLQAIINCGALYVYEPPTLQTELAKRLGTILGSERLQKAGRPEARELTLLGVVLGSRDAELQKHLLGPRRNSGHGWFSKEFLPTYVSGSELEAFYELVRYRTSHFVERSGMGADTPKVAAIDATLNRLAALARGPNGRMNPEAVTALAEFSAPVTPEQLRKVLDAIAPLLEGSFQPGAPEDELSACGDLVRNVLRRLCCGRRPPEPGLMHMGMDGMITREYKVTQEEQPCLDWADVPPELRDVCRRFFAYVNHPVHGEKARAALRACCRGFAGLPPDVAGPDMLAAIDAARAAVMEKGTADEQVELLASMTWATDDATVAAAVAELQKRTAAGMIPAEKREDAYYALARGGAFLTPEFVLDVLDRLADPKEDKGHRRSLLYELLRHPTVYEQLLPIAEKLQNEDPAAFNAPWCLPPLVVELRRLTKEKAPRPPWAKAAASLALKLAPHAKEQSACEVAVDLYAAAAGPDGVATLESLAQDATLAPYTRAAAAQDAIELNPDTMLLSTLLESYDKLPVEMREQLAGCAANSPAAPGAEAFLIRALKDPRVLARRYIVTHVEIPLTPALRACLKELEADPVLGEPAKQAIERLGNAGK